MRRSAYKNERSPSSVVNVKRLPPAGGSSGSTETRACRARPAMSGLTRNPSWPALMDDFIADRGSRISYRRDRKQSADRPGFLS